MPQLQRSILEKWLMSVVWHVISKQVKLNYNANNKLSEGTEGHNPETLVRGFWKAKEALVTHLLHRSQVCQALVLHVLLAYI